MVGNCAVSRFLVGLPAVCIVAIFLALVDSATCANGASHAHTALRVKVTDERYNEEHRMSLSSLSEHIARALQKGQMRVVASFGAEAAQFPQHCELHASVGFLNFYQSAGGTWFGKCMLTSLIRNVRTETRSEEFHTTVSIPFSTSAREFRRAEAEWEGKVLSDAAKALAQDVKARVQAPTVSPIPPAQPPPRVPAQPQIAAGTGQRWALVVGVSKYKDARVPILQYADDDARAFAEWLVSPKDGAYRKENVRVLLNADATGEKLREALFSWLSTPIAEDTIVMYFACHGSSDSPDSQDNLFLLPFDVDYGRIAVTAFPMWDVRTALKRYIKARQVVLIADACHSAGIGTEFDIRRRSGRGMKVNPIATGLRDLATAGESVCVISASDTHQYSQEGAQWGGGHGVFTFYLLQALAGAADSNKDSQVSIGELLPFLSEQVRRATKNAQCPRVAGSYDPAMMIGAQTGHNKRVEATK